MSRLRAKSRLKDMREPEPKHCTLRLAASGEIEVCPEDRCAFWESGGAVLRGDCLVERLGIDVRDAELAAYLLETRGRLERARDSIDSEAAHREVARRLGRDV